MLFYEGEPFTYFGDVEHRYVPRWLMPESSDTLRRGGARYESLLECCRVRRPSTVWVRRTYALGDILMLVPVLRAFHRLVGLPKPIVMGVEDRFMRDLAPTGDERVRFRRDPGQVADMGCDVHIDLNGCLEPDHRGGWESDVHRMALYARAIGADLEVPA